MAPISTDLSTFTRLHLMVSTHMTHLPSHAATPILGTKANFPAISGPSVMQQNR